MRWEFNVLRMSTTADYIAAGFERMNLDLNFLMECLKEVLEEIGETQAARCLPWVEGSDAVDAENPPVGIEQAFSIAFQMLNMVEENASAQTRRFREIEHGLKDEPGCWGRVLTQLKGEGVDAATMLEILPEVRVEPVLTAHPTEAKRASVLEQHRAIYTLLTKRDDPSLTPSQGTRLREGIKVSLERLWRSGEILLEKPEVAAERRGVLFYLREVFPQALRQLDARLREAWAEVEFDDALLEDPHRWPRLRFGSWVGGDRDGHPLVTDEVTRRTLEDLRTNGLLVIHRLLGELASELPLSSNFQAPPTYFIEALEKLSSDLPDAAAEIGAKHSDEPWRKYVYLLQKRLPVTTGTTGEAVLGDSEAIPYRNPEELDDDLALLCDSLREVGAERLVHKSVWPVRRALDVFGFHLAALDIRQNSAFHDRALTQILKAAGFQDYEFAEWDETKRLDFLRRELESPRPFLRAEGGIGKEADALLACYAILRRQIREHGRSAIGSLIVSMTRQLSDLLVVYVLAREAGLTRWTQDGLLCSIPVVPLFETLDDLQRSPGLIRDFLENPVTQRSLSFQQTDRERVLSLAHAQPIQQVMIGYSDSNKDCGALASQWGLHRAQQDIAKAGQEAGVKIRFFHGRGGTISRGAGPTHRFLAALPDGSIQGDMRLTEQGETIAQKYSNIDTATYNLELLMAGVTGFTASDMKTEVTPPQQHWDKLASISQSVYRGLVDLPEFIPYFTEATPIDALEMSRIGSRPARRTGKRSLADLRAIPWVFSWNQSRHYLPGWFGVGTALETFREDDPAGFESLSSTLRKDPFAYYVFANVETNLASADAEMMQLYASLVTDPNVRDKVLNTILSEFERTRTALARLFGGTTEERRPRMLKTLGLRADALSILHKEQVTLLRQWRANPDEAGLLPKILLSINAIASGLRTTG